MALELRDSTFKVPDVEAIGCLTSLTSLTLARCRLQRLPPWLTRLTALSSLNLSSDDLQLSTADVRSVLACLTNLTCLSLYRGSTSAVAADLWVELARSCPHLNLQLIR